jgi:putative NADH-flavin reductase
MKFIFLLFVLFALALSAALSWRGLRGRRLRAAATGTVPLPVPARLLIVGATGGTGRQLVAQALERGHLVTALARNPSKLAIEHTNLRVVRGDVLDRASLDAAVQGQDAVLSALGHKRFLGPTRILSQGTGNLIEAMEAHGVRRLVCETSLGIGDGAWRMGLSYTLFVIPVVLPFYFWDKARQEQVVAASRLDWVIVRPAVLTDGAARHAYRHGAGVGNAVLTRRIARADVAAFMLDQVTGDANLGTATGICW